MSSPLSNLLKAQAADRALRSKTLEQKVGQVLVSADALENDLRAAVGLQLISVVSNQQQLDDAVRNLRQQVASLHKRCGQWSGQYDALKQSVADIGSLETYLVKCDSQLARINEHLELAGQRLASEWD